MSSVELPFVSIWYEKPVVYYVYKQEIELGFPEIRQLISHAEELSNRQPYMTFSDIRKASISVTKEGKRYLANESHLPFFRGAAVLVNNSMLSFAINFMSQFDKKSHPYKAFADKEKALLWIQEQASLLKL